MNTRSCRGLLWLCLFALCPLLHAQGPYLFNLQNTVGSGTVSIFGAESATLTSAGAIAQPPGTIQLLARPDGSRFYLISQVTGAAITAWNSSFTSSVTLGNFTAVPVAAAITPDGSRMVVATSEGLYIFDLTVTPEAFLTMVPLTGGVTDLGISLDSLSAYTVNSTGLFSLVTLSTGNVTTLQLALDSATGLTVGPDGYVYVSGLNGLAQVEGRGTLALGPLGKMATVALLGKPAITEDAHYAVAVNQTPASGSALVAFDLIAGTSTPVPAVAGTTFNHVYPAGSSRIFVTALTDQKLYEWDPSTTTVAPTSLIVNDTPTLFSNVLAVALSGEVPNPNYIYVLANVNGNRVLHQINLRNGNLEGRVTLSSIAGQAVFFSQPSHASVSFLQGFNNGRTVATGQTVPFVVRALDLFGLPVPNLTVNFTLTDGDTTVSTISATTNNLGFVQVAASSLDVGVHTILASASTVTPLPLSFLVSEQAPPPSGGGGTGGLTIVSGNGQLVPSGNSYMAYEPMVVRVTDPSGNPLANVPVTYTITSGRGFLPGGLTTLDTVSDANGLVSVGFGGGVVDFGLPFEATTIQVSTATDSVNFIETTFPYTDIITGSYAAWPNVNQVDPANPSVGSTNRNLSGQAGVAIANAFAFQITTIFGYGSGSPVPNVGLRIVDALNQTNPAPATCAGGPLSDQNGLVICNLIPVAAGNFTIRVYVGDIFYQDFNLTVTPGVPTTIQKAAGSDNQSGNPGSVLQLQAAVLDGAGDPITGTSVTWQVLAGTATATLQNTVNTSNASGVVSTQVKLGSTPGPVSVKVTAGSASATFTVNVQTVVASLTVSSGNPQSAIVGQPFGQPLVVLAKDTLNNALSGAVVSFAVTSGAATLSSPSATTDTQGHASITVTASATAGPVVVTATLGAFTATFNLTILPPGPQITAQSIGNAASYQVGLSPCELATVIGPGLAPGISGVVQPVGLPGVIGPFPYTLGGDTITVAGYSAPLLAVANVGGTESVNFQVPCEVTPGNADVVVTVAGNGSATVNVQVTAYQPGIFEYVASNSSRYAVAVKANGSYVLPGTNPAHPGDTITIFMTGLGQTTPLIQTNNSGVNNQAITATLVAGVGTTISPVSMTQYMVGAVGVYMVQIQIPSNLPVGASEEAQTLWVAVQGNPAIFANQSHLPIAP